MKHRLLIVYYSHSANTRRLAQMIQERSGGDVAEIEPETPYPIDYRLVVRQAKEEIEQGFCPPIQKIPADLSHYDAVAVGSPNWCGTMAPPVRTFMEEHPLQGKRILPFCTHGGSGFGDMVYDMEQICREADFLPGYESYGGVVLPSGIDRWLKKSGVLNVFG